MKKWILFRTAFFAFSLILTAALFSCNNSASTDSNSDSTSKTDSKMKSDSESDSKGISEGNPEETKVLHISKEDSAKAADSARRAKNPIRDFN